MGGAAAAAAEPLEEAAREVGGAHGETSPNPNPNPDPKPKPNPNPNPTPTPNQVGGAHGVVVLAVGAEEAAALEWVAVRPPATNPTLEQFQRQPQPQS